MVVTRCKIMQMVLIIEHILFVRTFISAYLLFSLSLGPQGCAKTDVMKMNEEHVLCKRYDYVAQQDGLLRSSSAALLTKVPKSQVPKGQTISMTLENDAATMTFPMSMAFAGRTTYSSKTSKTCQRKVNVGQYDESQQPGQFAFVILLLLLTYFLTCLSLTII